MLNVLQVAVMAIASLYVFGKTQFAENRLVALVPLGMALLDITSLTADFLAVPALFIVMEAARLAVLGCCAAALRRDRRMVAARNRERAKEKFRMRMAAVEKASNVYEMPLYA